MPYDVVKEGEKYCVLKKGGSKQFGCHETREQANAQVAALYAAEKAVATAGLKDYDLEMAVYSRQVSREQADYNPLGATVASACANCNWFVSPNQCLLVWGDISPTGLSKLWMEEAKYVYEPEPMPVYIVDEKSDAKQPSILEAIKRFFGLANDSGVAQSPSPVQSGVSFFDTKEGQTRFFLWGSNHFKDRSGDIFETAAHKEFIEWADENHTYPELWLWHAKGSRLGQIDWLDFADGFLVASGLVDGDKANVVTALKGQDLGVSHAFLCAASKGIIRRYRSWEFSVLPRGSADNIWTSFAAIKEEVDMGFSPNKRAWLMEVAGVDEAQVKEFETQTEAMVAKLQALGIEWKEAPEDTGLVSTLAQLQSVVTQLAEGQAALTQELTGLKSSEDERFMSLIQGEIAKLPQGFQASASEETIVGGSAQTTQQDLSWFGKEVLGQLVKS